MLYETNLDDLPADVTGLSLGCGDPIVLAGLQPGQTVLDLGSGGGIDAFLAAQRVGETGRVIGVDMTPAMLAKAEQNKAKLGLSQVEFREGRIEELPVETESVDVVISNCVINLSPDKAAVFREAFRVLRPGGRLAVSDMVTQGYFTAEERANLPDWAACVTGAEDVRDYIAAMRQAGFTEIVVRDKFNPDIELSEGAENYVGSARLFSAAVTAVKPFMSDSKSYFAQVAGQWDDIRAGFFTEAMRDAAIEQANLPETAVVADIGTGTGFVLQGLAGRAARLVGFDESPDMLAIAQQNLNGYNHVELRLAEGQNLPAEDNGFDAVFANMYLHHAPDPAAAIAEMSRILKPGGKLIITDLDSHDQSWMREAMADRWLGFAREDVRQWYEAAGLTAVEIDCAAGSCDCVGPNDDEISLSVFAAVGQK